MAGLGLLLVVSPRPASAQSPGHEWSPGAPMWRVGAYVGEAEHSVNGIFIGVTPDRNHRVVGLDASATVLEMGRVSLAYAPSAMPLMIVTNNPTYGTIIRHVQGRAIPTRIETGRAPVMGAGFAPFGVEIDVALLPHWHVYGNSAAGAIWFRRDVPVLNSRTLNLTFEMGSGLLWEYRRGRWIQAGYKYHHLSNAGTAPQNPGLNANLIYLGWQRRFGGKRS
jgi:hypothetical protein